MNATLHGLHHVTAIASDARRNVEFYTQVLGLRLIKKTVNFDDPGAYHLFLHGFWGGFAVRSLSSPCLPTGRPKSDKLLEIVRSK